MFTVHAHLHRGSAGGLNWLPAVVVMGSAFICEFPDITRNAAATPGKSLPRCRTLMRSGQTVVSVTSECAHRRKGMPCAGEYVPYKLIKHQPLNRPDEICSIPLPTVDRDVCRQATRKFT